MCDLTEVDYQKGDIVWVKLGSLWWPGLVHDYDSLPEDIKADTQAFKKKPIAYVKFFQEENFEYVKDIHSIYHYNCFKKNEFIKKGLDMMRSSRVSNSNMQLFPGDVITAENLTNGDPRILDLPEFQADEEAGKVVYEELFSSPSQKKLKKKKDGKEMSPMVGGFLKLDPRRKSVPSKLSKSTSKCFPQSRLLNLSADAAAKGYQSKELIQPEDTNGSQTKNFSCVDCNYQCSRVNVMLLHYQTHTRSFDHKIKYPAGFKRKKRNGNNTSGTGGVSKKIKLTNGIEDVGKKVRSKAEILEQQKQEAEKLKQNFLMDWNEDEPEEAEEEDLDESVEKSTTSKEGDKTSCFDFDDDDEEASSSTNNISFAIRKRLLSKSEEKDKGNLTNGKDLKAELIDEVEALLNETQVPTLPDIPSNKGGDAITLPPPTESMPEFGTLNSDLNDSLEFRNEIVDKVSSTPANTNVLGGKLSKQTLKTNFLKKYREEIAEEAKFKEDDEDEPKEEEDFVDEDICDENEIDKKDISDETEKMDICDENDTDKDTPEETLGNENNQSEDIVENEKNKPEGTVEYSKKEEGTKCKEVKTEISQDKTKTEQPDFKQKEPVIEEQKPEKPVAVKNYSITVNDAVEPIKTGLSDEDKPNNNENTLSKITVNDKVEPKETGQIHLYEPIIKQNTQGDKIIFNDDVKPINTEKINNKDKLISNQNTLSNKQESPIAVQEKSNIKQYTPSKVQEKSSNKQESPSKVQDNTHNKQVAPSKVQDKSSKKQDMCIKIQDRPSNKQDTILSKTQAQSPMKSGQEKLETKSVEKINENQPSVVQIGNQTIHIPVRQNTKTEARQSGERNTKTEEDRLSKMILEEEVDSVPQYVSKPPQPTSTVHIDMSPKEKKTFTVDKQRGPMKSMPTIIPIESMRPKYKPINIPSSATRQVVSSCDPTIKPAEEKFFILPNNQRIKTPSPVKTQTKSKIVLTSPDVGKIVLTEKRSEKFQQKSHQGQVVYLPSGMKHLPKSSSVPLITVKSPLKKPNLPVPGLMKINAAKSSKASCTPKPKPDPKPQSLLQTKIKNIAHSNASRPEPPGKPSTAQGSILVNQSTLPSILQQRRSTQPVRVQPPALVHTPKLVEEPELISEISSIPGADSRDSVVYLINNQHSQQILINNPVPTLTPSTTDSQTYYIDPSSTDLSNIYLTIDDDGNILNIVQKTDEVQTAGPHSDILAQALADTQVLQAESAVTGPGDASYQTPIVNNTYETSLTLNQAPIMSTSEAPSQLQHTSYYTSASSLPLVEIRPGQEGGATALPDVAYSPSGVIPT